VNDRHYIASSEFIEQFPGWCYSCLTEHCAEQDCETCIVSKDPDSCSFKEVKNIYSQTNS
jgi:hypothetical protein